MEIIASEPPAIPPIRVTFKVGIAVELIGDKVPTLTMKFSTPVFHGRTIKALFTIKISKGTFMASEILAVKIGVTVIVRASETRWIISVNPATSYILIVRATCGITPRRSR